MSTGVFDCDVFDDKVFDVLCIIPSPPWGDGVGGGKGHKVPHKREKAEEDEILMLIQIIHERRYKMVMGDG